MWSITNPTVTREELWRTLRRTHDVHLRERSHGILLLMDGKSCPEIAPWLSREVETIRRWVRAFNEAGLQGLERAPGPGRSPAPAAAPPPEGQARGAGGFSGRTGGTADRVARGGGVAVRG